MQGDLLEADKAALLVAPPRDVAGMEAETLDPELEGSVVVGSKGSVALSKEDVVVVDDSAGVGKEGGRLEVDVVDDLKDKRGKESARPGDGDEKGMGSRSRPART
jgi:hypothetical protein